MWRTWNYYTGCQTSACAASDRVRQVSVCPGESVWTNTGANLWVDRVSTHELRSCPSDMTMKPNRWTTYQPILWWPIHSQSRSCKSCSCKSHLVVANPTPCANRSQRCCLDGVFRPYPHECATWHTSEDARHVLVRCAKWMDSISGRSKERDRTKAQQKRDKQKVKDKDNYRHRKGWTLNYRWQKWRGRKERQKWRGRKERQKWRGRKERQKWRCTVEGYARAWGERWRGSDLGGYIEERTTPIWGDCMCIWRADIPSKQGRAPPMLAYHAKGAHHHRSFRSKNNWWKLVKHLKLLVFWSMPLPHEFPEQTLPLNIIMSKATEKNIRSTRSIAGRPSETRRPQPHRGERESSGNALEASKKPCSQGKFQEMLSERF